MKLACADFAFPLLPFEKSLDLIAMIGVKGADIGLFEGRGSLQPSKELKTPEKRGAALQKTLADRGLKLADLFLQNATDFTSMAINHPEENIRKLVRNAVERTLVYTKAAGGSHTSLLPGVQWPEETPAQSLERSATELAWCLERAKSYGITLSIEGHIGSHVATPQLLKRLLQLTPGLTLTLDYGHFIYQNIRQSAVHELIPHASHFHARCGAPERLQTSLKNNKIDFATILQKMKESRYTGWLGLEYVWVDWEHCNEVDNLSETILLRDHLKRSRQA